MLQVPPSEKNEEKEKHLKRKANEVPDTTKEKKHLKRKANEFPDTTKAKIKKTEESIRLLKNHLQRNTYPKSLKYSARANIPADEQFKKDIKAIKQKAERGFVEALTRFHYRRLEIQKKKLNKEMSMANRKGSKDNKNVNVSTTEDRNEIEALASKLKEQYDYLMSKLDNVTENKNCKKYSYMSVKCLNNTAVQPSVALESYLEEVKSHLAEIEITKPKFNLSRKEHQALIQLKQNTDININIKKADKGSTTVVMNKTDKIREGQIQIDDEHNYRPLPEPMVKETHKVLRLITDLHREKHIDDMTRKWLSQTPNPPRIPEF
ncbi:synaptonemal complex protein 1-like [Montipora foliosa]|uniref:synaptonemal complex protein 1-like n=1 Tax=Montipora foliosa TaxID=591990 RepID=UPI0035F1F1D3